jgi:putative (di)nucleoside polyphosphate hydrolase
MSQNQYFRAGAGSVIYNAAGEILLFSRTDQPSIWQLQQGGMDAGETPQETLWRELFEETALSKDDVEQVTKFPNWLQYEYPEEMKPRLKDINCLGQIHQWYFLKLKAGTVIDLDQAVDKEFTAAKWETFDHLLGLPETLKKQVYSTLATYFIENIHQKH